MSKITTKITKNYFENAAWAADMLVCGIDEVGRGCLAGPVVTGAAIIQQGKSHPLLKDSKALTAQQRNEAFTWINEHCWWSVALANNRIVDSINIYQTTLLHMKKAYQQLIEQIPFAKTTIKYLVTDAMPLEITGHYGHEKLECYHFNKGETLSTSIAAASIVAKVTRDRIIDEMSQYFPTFGFSEHKGYATQQHCDALKKLGPSAIHRLSFLSFLEQEKQETQSSLF